MNKIVALIMLAFVFGCTNMQLARTIIPPKTTYQIEQATLTSPNEKNWYLIKNDLHLLTLGKRLDNNAHTVVLSAAMYPVKAAKTSKLFLEYIADQREKNDDAKRFKVVSIKNEYVTFKGLPCLKYRTTAEDHRDDGISSTNFSYFKTSGYICRYPLEYIALQIEVSERSQNNDFQPDLLKDGQDFFQSIQLVEPTIKRLQVIP